MSNHSNARPHVIKSRTNSNVDTATETAVSPAETNEPPVVISNAVKRRAQAVINDSSIDAESRAIVRYGLETNDPWLTELVRRADAGESLAEALASFEFSQTDNEPDAGEEKVEALVEMICRAGDECAIKAAALLALFASIENARHSKAVANLAKHVVFRRCGELNTYGIVDAQVAMLESELFSSEAVNC